MYKIGFWVLLILVIVSAIGGAYYLGQQNSVREVQKSSENSLVIMSSSSPTTEPVTTSKVEVKPSAAAVSAKPTPAVVFEAEGSILATDKSQIHERIVNPLVDYYAEHSDEQELVSLTISPNNQAGKAQSPYLGQAIFKGGGNSGFVINKTNGQIEWWGVDCMICTFSNEYKTKYPEVVKNYL